MIRERIYIGRTGRLALPLLIVAAICLSTDNAEHYISYRGIIVMTLTFPLGWIGRIGADALANALFGPDSLAALITVYLGTFIASAINIYLLSAGMLFLSRKSPPQKTRVSETELQNLLKHHRGDGSSDP